MTTRTLPNCHWCNEREAVWAFANLNDFDVLRDPEPPDLLLCEPCRVESGLSVEEPDACAEHPAGCPSWAHTSPAYDSAYGAVKR